MKKNVIWWVGVKNEQYSKKYGGWTWMDISRKTWEFWCKKNDVLFVPFEKPIEEDLTKFRINWQKAMFVFDELESRNIDYDQICLIDCTHMIKWDAPNFFELTEHKLCGVRDTDNLNWIYKSIKGYESFFDYELDIEKYVSSSPMIFNKKHKHIFNSFKDLYYDNVDTFVELQDKIVRKGTEQTPLNYWIQKNNVDMKFLPMQFKLTHIHRKDMFHHNWQLNEDKTPFFIKYGHNWVFTGFEKDQRSNIMKQVWADVKHNYDDNYILNTLVHKDEWVKTTTRKFKEDILRIFKDKKDLVCLELGACRGHTTRVLSECFKKVYAVEQSIENVEHMKQVCSDVGNVEIIQADVYAESFEIPDNIDIAYVDAGHTASHIEQDIKRLLAKNKDMILIFDDYGQPDEVIKKSIHSSGLKISQYIGEYNGFTCKNGQIKFVTREGVICNLG